MISVAYDNSQTREVIKENENKVSNKNALLGRIFLAFVAFSITVTYFILRE